MKYSMELKQRIMKDHFESGITVKELDVKYQIPKSTIYAWIREYESYGGIKPSKYPDELKNLVIQEYLKGSVSLMNVATKYNVPYYTAESWYRNHKAKNGMDSTKSFYPYELKKAAVTDYLDHNEPFATIARKHGISTQVLWSWVNRVNAANGDLSVLELNQRYNKYPIEVKFAAIEDLLSGEYSYQEVCKKYNIHSVSTLEKWYYNYKETGSPTTNKGIFNVDPKEKQAIIDFFHNNGENYRKTAKMFRRSYCQIYNIIHVYKLSAKR